AGEHDQEREPVRRERGEQHGRDDQEHGYDEQVAESGAVEAKGGVDDLRCAAGAGVRELAHASWRGWTWRGSFSRNRGPESAAWQPRPRVRRSPSGSESGVRVWTLNRTAPPDGSPTAPTAVC